MTIHEKLLAIQTSLKAPKNQKNTFGGYKYRSCEDILEALKPLLREHKCTLTLSDDIAVVGERYYVRANASLANDVNPTDKEYSSIAVSAYAREAESKKGMDESQITGAASSYARKYALNGLFCIDDTKDADSMDNSAAGASNTPASPKKASAQQVREIAALAKDLQMDVKADIYAPMKIAVQPNESQAAAIIERLTTKKKEAEHVTAATDSK